MKNIAIDTVLVKDTEYQAMLELPTQKKQIVQVRIIVKKTSTKLRFFNIYDCK